MKAHWTTKPSNASSPGCLDVPLNSDMKIRINEARLECTECRLVSHGLVWVIESEFEDEVVLCTECVYQAAATFDESN